MYFDYKIYKQKVDEADAQNLNAEDLMKRIDATITAQGKERSDATDISILVDSMSELESWCNAESIEGVTSPKETRQKFFHYFQDSIIGAYYRYRTNKRKAWSMGKNWIGLICAAITPLLSPILIFWLTEGGGLPIVSFSELATGDNLSADIAGTLADGIGTLLSTSNVLVCIFIAACVGIKIYLDWDKAKNSKETWVRHSTCFGRLNLVLSRFILSERKERDYQELVRNTFAVLDQNLDQFTLNMSSSGLAERADVDIEGD